MGEFNFTGSNCEAQQLRRKRCMYKVDPCLLDLISTVEENFMEMYILMIKQKFSDIISDVLLQL